MRKLEGKKAAMEMSVGTIVTIVLLMTVLILGLVLVRTIFSGGINSVGKINDKVSSQIDELFSENEDLRMAIYPSDNKMKIAQKTQGEGFAFSLQNINLEEKKFKYKIFVDELFKIKDQCNINSNDAESWLINPQGEISLAGSQEQERPELVLFNIPESAPKCTIPFTIEVREGTTLYTSGKVFVTIV